MINPQKSSLNKNAGHNPNDLDTDTFAFHHTLGEGPNQAAKGNHSHESTGDLKASFAEGDGINWLTLDGSDVSRTEYSALFDLFGTTYGVGDGSTTFGLPDTTGALLMGGTPANVGDFAGDADNSITLTVAQLPSHNHVFDVRENSGFGTAAAAAGSVAGTADTRTTNNTGSGNPIDITPYHLKVFWLVHV